LRERVVGRVGAAPEERGRGKMGGRREKGVESERE
jgi:hypothetical protein